MMRTESRDRRVGRARSALDDAVSRCLRYLERATARPGASEKAQMK
jgi:hypothetical protein